MVSCLPACDIEWDQTEEKNYKNLILLTISGHCQAW